MKVIKAVSPSRMAWLLPLTLLAHQLEEYIGNFPQWYSDLLNASLSNQEWIIINVIGLIGISIYCLSYFITRNNVILVAIGTLVFVNGIIHLVASMLTFSYSPGVITGVVLFLPLGGIVYRDIMPQLTVNQKIIAIIIGVGILVMASTVAMNI